MTANLHVALSLPLPGRTSADHDAVLLDDVQRLVDSARKLADLVEQWNGHAPPALLAALRELTGKAAHPTRQPPPDPEPLPLFNLEESA